MHTNEIFNALNCINNSINSCINCMLSIGSSILGASIFWLFDSMSYAMSDVLIKILRASQASYMSISFIKNIYIFPRSPLYMLMFESKRKIGFGKVILF